MRQSAIRQESACEVLQQCHSRIGVRTLLSLLTETSAGETCWLLTCQRSRLL
jgi:hypothetical protein